MYGGILSYNGTMIKRNTWIERGPFSYRAVFSYVTKWINSTSLSQLNALFNDCIGTNIALIRYFHLSLIHIFYATVS